MRQLLLLLVFAVVVGATTMPATPVPFTVPDVDQVMDLHGDPSGADLVIFAGGNEWFALPDIVAAFKASHPRVKRVFYETLPPGVLVEQIESGGLQVGELTLHVRPDVVMAGRRRMKRLNDAGVLESPVIFASNVLGILVRDGNPKHITSLHDLGRDDVRVAMPNPATEGIARQIEMAYKKAGGDALDSRIMQTKLQAGTTMLTTIHHRETPLWILQDKVDAGPVWISEAIYQEKVRSGLIAIPIEKNVNVTGIYVAAAVRRAPHLEAARAFTQFLLSPRARAIYASYGFLPPAPTEE